MWKNVFYLKSKWGWITSAHGLFQMAFNFARECVFLIGVSEGESVRARACRWSRGWLHPIPQSSFLLAPCLENPIMEGGCARLEGWAGSTSVWRERGGRREPRPGEQGPVGRARAAQTGPWVWGRRDTQLNRRRPPCRMTHSDTLLTTTGFCRRGDVNHRELWVCVLVPFESTTAPT